MHGGTCAHEGELVAMKDKIVGFWGGALRKRPQKSPIGGNCAREGELAPMKAKLLEFWLNTRGTAPMKVNLWP